METALFNINLIRRRIRDPQLRFEALQVGRRSKTDVMVGYIEDVADPSLVNEVKSRIEAIDRDAIPMGGKTWRSTFWAPCSTPPGNPLYRAARCGRGPPFGRPCGDHRGYHSFALIVPVTLWHFTQHAEEYFQNPPVGTYLRWIRTAGIIGSLILLPSGTPWR